jgi:hypothetical protein
MKCFIYLTFALLSVHNAAMASLDELRPPEFSDLQWNSLRSAMQEAKLLPTPAGPGGQDSYFGQSIAVDGNRALIGAPGMGATGLVSVLEYDGAQWQKTALLSPSDGDDGDDFGFSVSLSGNLALIGAPQADGVGLRSGAAYVYEYNGTSWSEMQKLTGFAGQSDDAFGHAVSLDADKALISDPLDEGGQVYAFFYDGISWSNSYAVGLGGTDFQFGYAISMSGNKALIGTINDNDLGAQAGAVYAYELSGTFWSRRQKLTASDGTTSDQFGTTISLSGDVAMVGANDGDGLNTDSGAVYAFSYANDNWIETQKLQASDGQRDDVFGKSISLLNDQVLIGASRSDGAETSSGSAYLFAYDGMSWTESQKLTASDGSTGELFGTSLVLTNSHALIGARFDRDLGGNSGSVYIQDFDGSSLTESQKVIGEDGAAKDLFGEAVSIHGNRALVGARLDDELGNNSGSAYIFAFDGTSWNLMDKVLASDGSTNDNFGSAVGLFGDLAVVSAPRDDDHGESSGSVYVFQYDGMNWTEVQKLTATDAAEQDRFGNAVSVYDERILVGAHWDDDFGGFSGSAYVFDHNGLSWTETHKLTASDGQPADKFAGAVSLFGDRALFGALGDDDYGNASGAAYIFDFDGISWSETQKLTATDASEDDQFGFSVSLSGDRVLIGARTDLFNNMFPGSAYVFDFNGIEWTETQKITASDGQFTDGFGSAVSLSGDRLLVGAAGNDEGGYNAGIAYAFRFDNGTWSETDKLVPADAAMQDSFGISVSISGDLALIGAGWDDDRGTNSGSAYVFDLLPEYEVIVNVNGLAASNTVSFSNGVDTLIMTDNSSQTLSVLNDGSDYEVMITTQPTTPNQVCSFTSAASGTLNGTDVVIGVQCVTTQYNVGGTVTGLAAGNAVVLQNNLTDDLTIADNGAFTFSTPLDDESTFAVSVLTNPDSPNQSCEVSQGSGQLAGAPVDDVLITCVTESYTLGGQLTGLAAGNSLTLSLNGGEQYLVIDANGGFQFSSPLEDLTGYNTSVHTTPDTPSQSCQIKNATGTVSGGPVTDIDITCEVDSFYIGGFIAGLIPDNNLVLQNNGTDQLLILSEGPFVFGTPLTDESDYAVTIMFQPDDPLQDCELFNETGTLAGDDVDNVFISCAFGDDLIYRHGFDDPNPINQIIWEPELTP